jgi:ribosome-associated protein
MQKVSFNLISEFIELNQLLKVVLVASGQVKVDGKQELRKTCKIRAGQQVSIGDVRITVEAGVGADGA